LADFRKWVTVVALTSTTRRPSELSLVALTRARAAEVIARDSGLADPDDAFTVGLVSALDALFERPLETLLEELPLSKGVRHAVLDFGGPTGSILSAVTGCEQEGLETGAFEPGLVNRAWLEGVAWAEKAHPFTR
jgi:EAL and modified HD-GYP domain-containing signal transduction protein